MKRRILVTGGAGYIGAHAVAELSQAGHDVVIIDNHSKSDDTLLRGLTLLSKAAPNFHNGDCGDAEFMSRIFKEQGPFDSVLHFAAYKAVGESVQRPLMYYQNNLGSLLVLLTVMKQYKVRDLIFSSSCTVYGQPDKIPVDESAPFNRAESPYGATKQMCERILKDACHEGFRFISLRYFNPIGAHPSGLLGELSVGAPNNLVPYITQTAAGIRQKLTIHGNDYNTPDGTCIRDFIHVTDLAIAHVQAMEYLYAKREEKFFEAFNLGTGVGLSVMHIIQEFIRINRIDVPYTIGPRRPGDVEKVYADPGKANMVLGWKTKFSIQDALRHAWAWETRP